MLTSRGRGPGAGRPDQLRVEVDPDDGPLRPTRPAASNATSPAPVPTSRTSHPGRDASVLQEPRGVRREHPRLQAQALGLPGRLAEQVIRCSPTHRDGLMTRRALPLHGQDALPVRAVQQASRPAKRPRISDRKSPDKHLESFPAPLALAMTIGPPSRRPGRRDSASLPSRQWHAFADVAAPAPQMTAPRTISSGTLRRTTLGNARDAISADLAHRVQLLRDCP